MNLEVWMSSASICSFDRKKIKIASEERKCHVYNGLKLKVKFVRFFITLQTKQKAYLVLCTMKSMD